MSIDLDYKQAIIDGLTSPYDTKSSGKRHNLTDRNDPPSRGTGAFDNQPKMMSDGSVIANQVTILQDSLETPQALKTATDGFNIMNMGSNSID